MSNPVRVPEGDDQYSGNALHGDSPASPSEEVHVHVSCDNVPHLVALTGGRTAQPIDAHFTKSQDMLDVHRVMQDAPSDAESSEEEGAEKKPSRFSSKPHVKHSPQRDTHAPQKEGAKQPLPPPPPY